jgi:hypothetical protein
VPAGWDQVPAACLAFGDTYAAERGEAARRGWPVNTLAGAHLCQLIDPAVVAAEIPTLMGRYGIDPLNQQRQPANRKRPEPGRGHSTAEPAGRVRHNDPSRRTSPTGAFRPTLASAAALIETDHPCMAMAMQVGGLLGRERRVTTAFVVPYVFGVGGVALLAIGSADMGLVPFASKRP